MDEVWDSEFTEKKALEDVDMEEESEWAAAPRAEAFKALYQCLLVHATNLRQSTGGNGDSAVRSGSQLVSVCFKLTCLVCLQGNT